ncbi:MAG: diacylglycerol kinase family protein [Candidatus Levybacteria bacterium]|nr:diacylglycerol kinase family protein [Candidatus Levybacteria bacterium]
MIDHQKLKPSFEHAVKGVHYAMRENQNLRIHLILAVLALVLAILLQVNPFELAVVELTILLVIAAEMINTAIEQMVDLITTEHRKEAEIAKDVSAGMVLVTAVGAIVIGVLIFSPYILRIIDIAL